MCVFSHNANAGLTHGLSSFIAAPDARPPAERTLALLASAGTRPYLLLPPGRRTALSRPIGRGTPRARTAMQTNPHLRDFQESAR
jgi:hypothetical protein